MSAGGATPALVLTARGWSALAAVPVASQAVGGLLVGQVTKRMGGVAKGFAIVGGLVLTGALQSLADGRLLSPELYLALVLVVARCVALRIEKKKLDGSHQSASGFTAETPSRPRRSRSTAPACWASPGRRPAPKGSPPDACLAAAFQ